MAYRQHPRRGRVRLPIYVDRVPAPQGYRWIWVPEWAIPAWYQQFELRRFAGSQGHSYVRMLQKEAEVNRREQMQALADDYWKARLSGNQQEAETIYDRMGTIPNDRKGDEGEQLSRLLNLFDMDWNGEAWVGTASLVIADGYEMLFGLQQAGIITAEQMADAKGTMPYDWTVEAQLDGRDIRIAYTEGDLRIERF